MTMIPLSTYTLALGALGLAAVSYALFRRKPKTPDELEKTRRVWLNEVGRITDGRSSMYRKLHRTNVPPPPC